MNDWTTMLGLALLGMATACGDAAESLRQDLGDAQPVGEWIYDDIDAGIEQASENGKPLLFTFRCVP